MLVGSCCAAVAMRPVRTSHAAQRCVPTHVRSCEACVRPDHQNCAAIALRTEKPCPLVSMPCPCVLYRAQHHPCPPQQMMVERKSALALARPCA